MRIRLTGAVLALVACNALAAGELYDAINALRSGDRGCARTAGLRALGVKPQLERAAALLAQGKPLDESVKEAGYRAARSAYIHISGGGSREQILDLLQTGRYCAQLQDAESADIGIYQDVRQLWILMAAPFAPKVEASQEAAGQAILALVNQARTEARSCGNKAFKAARPLRWNDALARASRLHAEDMAQHNYLAHEGRDGSKPAERVALAGYKYRSTGENIAGGQLRPEDAVAGWLKSPPHCANLMNPAYTEMGVAFAVDAASDMGVYWAQAFGTPR
jgi:uncharacterized protein YkwD